MRALSLTDGLTEPRAGARELPPPGMRYVGISILCASLRRPP